jgi:hypothetical protein
MSEAWTDYIDKCDRATVRACMAAVGEVIGKDVVALEKRCADLERELSEMKDRETTRRLRAVPPSPPDAMIG